MEPAQKNPLTEKSVAALELCSLVWTALGERNHVSTNEAKQSEKTLCNENLQRIRQSIFSNTKNQKQCQLWDTRPFPHTHTHRYVYIYKYMYRQYAQSKKYRPRGGYLQVSAPVVWSNIIRCAGLPACFVGCWLFIFVVFIILNHPFIVLSPSFHHPPIILSSSFHHPFIILSSSFLHPSSALSSSPFSSSSSSSSTFLSFSYFSSSSSPSSSSFSSSSSSFFSSVLLVLLQLCQISVLPVIAPASHWDVAFSACSTFSQCSVYTQGKMTLNTQLLRRPFLHHVPFTPWRC